MGKRSNFKRRARDFYPTPYEAVVPLLPHLRSQTRFCEPCAGAGDLIDHLTKHGHICARARDIEPQRDDIEKKDVMTTLTGNIDCFITNPPWPQKGQKGQPTVDIALFLSAQHPTWLLLSADFAHNKYFSQLNCVMIVSVGRVSWMANGNGGKDNCAWYLFDKNHNGPTQFIGRQ